MIRVVVALLLSLLGSAARVESQSPKKALMLVAPRPEYPPEASVRHTRGCGKFQIDMDAKTGAALKVHALQSTGHPALDRAAVSAFMKWRAKPGSIEHVVIPVCFDFRSGKPTVSY